MSDPSIGRSAKQAVVFLRQFFSDIQAVVTSLDQALYNHGWHAPRSKQISDELSNAIDANHWVIETVTRFYTPERSLQTSERILAVSFEFAPEALDESYLLCVGARWSHPVDVRDEVWQRWMSSDSILAFLGARPGIHELSRAQLDDAFLPGAVGARAFALPVCVLTDAAALQQKLVTPALSLVTER